MAATRASYGYQRLHVLLRAEGWRVNHTRVYRLYCEERLALKRKRPKRRKSAVARQVRPVATAPNQRWAMDFVHDVLADGRTIRILSVVDVFSRQSRRLGRPAGLPGRGRRAHPGRDRWRAYSPTADLGGRRDGVHIEDAGSLGVLEWRAARLQPRPGKPTDKAHVEAFHGSLRRECLSQHWFMDLADARRTLDQWRDDYNKVRPHSSLGHLPPAHFRSGGHFTPTRERLQI